MKIWRDDLYGNEDAQDFIEEMSRSLNPEESLEDYLAMLNDHPDSKYTECRLVLADFELDLTGELKDSDEVLDLIEQELSVESLNSWINQRDREATLLALKEKVELALLGQMNVAYETAWEWLKDKRD